MLRRHWFLAAYLAVLGAALAWPGLGGRGGVLHLDLLKPWCIAGIFLCAGLVLPSQRLGATLRDWRAQFVVQGVGFVVAPLLGLALAWAGGRLGLAPGLQAGLVLLACLPTTIGSCVAITGLAGGNQGIPLLGSLLGNLLGLLATPLLILLLLGHDGSTMPVAQVVGHLALLAILPTAIGQALRLAAADVLDRRRAAIGVVSGALLLVVLLGIFSDLARDGLGAGAWAAVGACLLLHGGLLGAAWLLARPPLIPARADRIAVAITASQKTAALGIPLAGALFAGAADLPQLLLPVAVYHIVQLVAGALLAARLARPTPCAAPGPRQDPTPRDAAPTAPPERRNTVF